MLEREKFDHIEERLKAIKGGGDLLFADMAELCLVPDVIIPSKFKVPDFDKYKGTTCPKNHLKMYCWNMGAYAKDEKLLMHFFKRVWLGQLSLGTPIWNLPRSVPGPNGCLHQAIPVQFQHGPR